MKQDGFPPEEFLLHSHVWKPKEYIDGKKKNQIFQKLNNQKTTIYLIDTIDIYRKSRYL